MQVEGYRAPICRSRLHDKLDQIAVGHFPMGAIFAHRCYGGLNGDDSAAWSCLDDGLHNKVLDCAPVGRLNVHPRFPELLPKLAFVHFRGKNQRTISYQKGAGMFGRNF